MITAIFYLSAPEALEDWEMKLISIETQPFPVSMFNLRRLMPQQAVEYMSQLVGSEKTVASASSNASKYALKHILRIVFYIEGEGSSTSNEAKTLAKRDSQ